MRKRLPLLLTAVGLVLFVVSYIYDAAVVTVPPQDASPEIAERWGEMLTLTMWLRTIGLFALIIGAFLWLARAVVKRNRKGQAE